MNDFQNLVGGWLKIDPRDVKMVTEGVNKNLRAKTARDDVFVRFSPASLHTQGELESEAGLLKALDHLGVPCCEIVEVGGRPILGPVKVADIEYNALVSRTIVGSALTPIPHGAMAFGRSLARVHRAASVDLPVKNQSLAGADRIHPILQPVIEDLTERASKLAWDDSKSKIGICHGDAWLGNAIMRDDTAVLFDFEFAGVGALAYDIATFIWTLRAESSEEEDCIFRSFVEGYRAVHDVEFQENELARSLLHKEINNIRFLCENVRMSREVTLATAQFARETMEFVLDDGIARFGWNLG